MNDFTKAKMFFRPYLKDAVNQYKSNDIEFTLCREILGDCIPNTDKFILLYFKKFPEKLNTRVFDIAVDTTVRNIMHDAILRHACEYLSAEICTECSEYG
jgi:hypothetical protein